MLLLKKVLSSIVVLAILGFYLENAAAESLQSAVLPSEPLQQVASSSESLQPAVLPSEPLQQAVLPSESPQQIDQLDGIDHNQYIAGLPSEPPQPADLPSEPIRPADSSSESLQSVNLPYSTFRLAVVPSETARPTDLSQAPLLQLADLPPPPVLKSPVASAYQPRSIAQRPYSPRPTQLAVAVSQLPDADLDLSESSYLMQRRRPIRCSGVNLCLCTAVLAVIAAVGVGLGLTYG